MDKEPKIRKKFPNDFDANEKVHKVKTDYSRSKNRDEIQKALDEMEEDGSDAHIWKELGLNFVPKGTTKILLVDAKTEVAPPV